MTDVIRCALRDPEAAWIEQGREEARQRALVAGVFRDGRDIDLLHDVCDAWQCTVPDILASVARLRDIAGMSDRDLTFVVQYGARIRAGRRRNHRALALFRSILDPEQRAEYGRCRHVTFAGSEGGTYRTMPSMGRTWRMERRGQVLRHAARYCYHDPDHALPPADVSAAHLLIIRSDEARFLSEANATPTRWAGL